SSEFLCRIAQKLKPNGILHIATDNVPYFNDIQANISALSLFKESPDSFSDISGIETDFERNFKKLGIHVTHRGYQLI
ncbi:hypothetical protein JYT61_00865, partial [bacterium AH-315-E10]|nr:hypothetical protein [bacterium AH-315-E10]